MKVKIILLLCMGILITHSGFSQQKQRESVIRVQDDRPVKKVTKRVYERYTPYPYYSYPWWGWGPYYPWGAPYYGPGYYGPGFGVYVGF